MAIKSFKATILGEEVEIPKLRMPDFEALTKSIKDENKASIKAKAAVNGIDASQLPNLMLAADNDIIDLYAIRQSAFSTVGARRIWGVLQKRLGWDQNKLDAVWKDEDPETLCGVAQRATYSEAEKAVPDPLAVKAEAGA